MLGLSTIWSYLLKMNTYVKCDTINRGLRPNISAPHNWGVSRAMKLVRPAETTNSMSRLQMLLNPNFACYNQPFWLLSRSV